MNRRIFTGDALVFGAVVTWALAFPIAKDALDRKTGWGDYVCAFNACRFGLVFAIFLPVVLWVYGLRLRRYIWPSVCVGGSLVVAYVFQSFAYAYTSAGTVAFVTALSVVLVPIWSRLCGSPITTGTAAGIALATVGLGFMSLTSGFTLDRGVLLALVGAVGFAADIVLVGRYRRLNDEHGEPLLHAVPFTAMQSLVVALMMTPLALAFEVPGGLPTITQNVIAALLYLAIIATGLGFTLQAVGQRYTTDVRVALISTLEAVIAAVAGYLILNEKFSAPMLIGMGLILTGTGLSEVSVALRAPAQPEPDGEVGEAE